MIKRSQALHSLFTRGTSLSDANGEITMIKSECDVKLIPKIHERKHEKWNLLNNFQSLFRADNHVGKINFRQLSEFSDKLPEGSDKLGAVR